MWVKIPRIDAGHIKLLFISPRHEKNDQNYETAPFDAPHCLDEQPPPPGDESEVQTQPLETSKASPIEAPPIEAINNNPEKVEPSEVNGSKTEHHHHHKKSRGGKKDEKEASSDDKKSRDKKKRKKSKEHERKKSKKDKKEKKVPGTPEVARTATPEKKDEEKKEVKQVEDEEKPEPTVDPADSFNRSDSILDINLEDEWIGAAPISKWEREENKSLDNSEVDVDLKKGGEEKVTSEVIKRAEHVLFTKAISAIRPKSPMVQVTVQGNDSQGARSVELKGSIKNRLGKKITEKNSRSRTPPPPVDQRSRKRESSRGKQLSSCIRVTNESRRKRTRTPEERRPSKRSRTPSRPQRPNLEKVVDTRTKQDVKKHPRSSSSSSASTNSGETSKRHNKHKMKKRSRSLSADSSSGNKRKKSKKEKKSKKKKKSRKPEKEKASSDTRRERD